MALKKPSVKGVIVNSTIVLTSFLIGFLVLEFVFARFYYSDVMNVSDTQYHPTLGWMNRPGSYVVKPPNGFQKHSIEIDELGLRTVNSDPGPDARQLVVLGDSFTYGKVIPTDQLFTTQLQSKLKQQEASFEVTNAGVQKYGTAQELLMLDYLAKNGVVGDVYLLVFFTNDILDNLRLDYGDLSVNEMQPGFEIDDNGDLVFAYRPPPEPEKRARELRSPKTLRTFDVVRTLIESYIQTRPELLKKATEFGFDVQFPRMPGLLNGWYNERLCADGTDLTRALLREIQHAATGRGAMLLVTMIPSPLQIYRETYGPMLTGTFPKSPLVRNWLDDPERPQRTVEKICEELGIPFLDLYPALREHRDQVLYIPREGHLTTAGHSVIAEQLAKFVWDQVN